LVIDGVFKKIRNQWTNDKIWMMLFSLSNH
jgi:hypothetical protein